MTAFPSYSTGTVSVANGDTAIVGSGTIWSGVNARPGDDIVIDGHMVVVQDVLDTGQIEIDPWPYDDVPAGTPYKIVQRSPLRFVGGQAMADVSRMVAALNTDGFYVFVAPDLTEPDPSYGEDGQYAFQSSSGKLWNKTGGAWSFLGIYKGFGVPAPYDNAHIYNLFDVATSGGSSYVWINETPAAGHAPPNATYWQVLAAKGDGATVSVGTTTTSDPGADASVTNTGTDADAVLDFTIPAGKTYGGTSTTSLAIGAGLKAFTTQANLAYQSGARVRATSTANTSNWMEGVATYSGTALTISADKISGSGTHADWNFNIVGEPGAGDVSSANKLSEYASVAADALANLNGVSYGAMQALTSGQRAQARSNINAVLKGHLFGLTLSTAGSSAAFTVAAGEAADSTGADLMALAAPLAKNTSAWAVGAGGALDTGSIANNTWYHVYLIKRPDTGVVDVLFSLSATAPTLPTNYTLFRRLGSMKTNGAAQWIGFTQIGDDFYWSNPIAETGGFFAIPTTRASLLLSVPTGIVVKAKIVILVNSSSGAATITFYSTFTTDGVPNINASPGFSVWSGVSSANSTSGPYIEVYTTTSGQISVRSDLANTNARTTTHGWVDTRGRLF
ncbi:hypothetical protein [Bradyrhizobium cenepequi]